MTNKLLVDCTCKLLYEETQQEKKIRNTEVVHTHRKFLL